MQIQTPAISIITPSFNMLPYLKRCSASISDQGLNAEHIVMDGGSSDGTADWLKANPGIISVSERDKGMYNALNKGIDRARADIIGHLNCDEQYLPDTLKLVVKFFDENPSIDFVAGDFLIVDPSGELLAYRKSFDPKWEFFFSNYLYTTTCALFYRRKIFDVWRFDESYRSIADVIFLYNVLKAGFKGTHIKRYFSVFTYSGQNLSLDPISELEKRRFNKTLPLWFRMLKPYYFLRFYASRVFNRTYSEGQQLSYSIYTEGDLTHRTTLRKFRPTFRLKFKRHD